MAKRRQVLEAPLPVVGMTLDVPSTAVIPRAGVDYTNTKIYFGRIAKQWGTQRFGTNQLSGIPSLIFEARFSGTNILEVLTTTNVYKYNSSTDAFDSDNANTFTGDYEDFWSATMFIDDMIYTNGVDRIQRKPSTLGPGGDMVSAYDPVEYRAYYVQGFQDHLCLYHVFEGGSEYAKRVRWSKKAPLGYTTGNDDFQSGTAGAIDLVDAVGGINVALPLLDSVVIYADRSIHIQRWVGGSEVFRFQRILEGYGTPSRRGVATYGNLHFIFGHDNVYVYEGGTSIVPIGEPIRKELYGNLNSQRINRVVTFFDEIERELYIAVPTGSNDYPDTVYVYKVDTKSWVKWIRPYTAYGKTRRASAVTIGELQGTIGDQNWKFGEMKVDVEGAIMVAADQYGYVVQEDPTIKSIYTNGASQSQTWVYETGDITAANAVDPIDREKVDFSAYDKRWLHVHVSAAGSGSLKVYYSTDSGTTWTQCAGSPATLNATEKSFAFDLDVRSNYIRLKFEHTDTNGWIDLTYYKLEFIPGTMIERVQEP